VRLLELYVSTQGEGPRVGLPTVFTRFAGCNLRCAGWPCDSPYAIFPDQYRKEMSIVSPAELANRIHELGVKNVCLTGGEPFLQKTSDLEELCNALWANGHTVECFSNGTLKYPDWAIRKLLFIMDWKLPGSHEDPFNETRVNNLERMKAYPNSKQAVKFVVKHWEDFQQAVELYCAYLDNTPIETFVGRVWSDDPKALTDAQLVQWVLDAGLNWRLNVQVHNHIWNRTQRGI
jgi:7-carboxy-7-deazaguanine synthase